MLSGDQNPLDLDRPLDTVLVHLVAHRHLRLPIRTQIRQDVRLAHLGEPLGQLVGKHDRQRHQLLGLPARVAEHHPLITRTHLIDRVEITMLHLKRLINTPRNVRRLLIERHDHTARLRVEAVLGPRIADPSDRLTDKPRNIHIRLSRDLTRNDHKARRNQRLTSHTATRIVSQDSIENSIRNLVGDLVGMPLRNGLRRETEGTCGHRGGKDTRQETPRNTENRARSPSALPCTKNERSGSRFARTSSGSGWLARPAIVSTSGSTSSRFT